MPPYFLAVGQGIGNGEGLHAGGPGLLDDAHVRDVVGDQGVKPDLELFRIPGDAVSLENVPGHGISAALLTGERGVGTGDAVDKEYAAVVESNHNGPPAIPAVAGWFLLHNIAQIPSDGKMFCKFFY